MISPKGAIAAEWSLFTIAVVLIGARVIVHLQMHMKNLLVSDAFLVLATLSCLGVVICDALTYKAGAMSNFTDPPVFILKIRFATNYLFDVGLYFPKFSMLAFYYRVIPIVAQKTRVALHTIACFVMLSALIALFGDTFWCGLNPAVNWSMKEGACDAFTSMTLVKINWSLNFCSEVLIFVLPLPLIYNLKLARKRERVGLMVIFLLGAITIFVSLARFVAMLLVSNNIAIYVLATTEFTVPIMILSLISLRPMLRRIHGWASSDHSGSPSSQEKNIGVMSGKPKKAHTSTSWQKLSHILYIKRNHQDTFGSEVELNEQEPATAHKIEEISLASEREPHFGDDDNKMSVN